MNELRDENKDGGNEEDQRRDKETSFWANSISSDSINIR